MQTPLDSRRAIRAAVAPPLHHATVVDAQGEASLTVMSVAYPLAPVRDDAVGGAEQIVHAIDCGLTRRGHRSIVVACAGSAVAGVLVSTDPPSGPLTPETREQAAAGHQRAVRQAIARWQPDVVHLHGHDFDAYLPPAGVPVLVTLHLPMTLLTARIDRVRRAGTWMHGVSGAQQRTVPPTPLLLPPIDNGVDVDRLPQQLARRGFALALGRICPEKGFHLALEAAHRARVPLLLAGIVFPYEAHQRYFEREIVPRLDRDRRFMGPVTTKARRRLLNSARCVLIPSVVEETSSLVAMEALACGTPVIAYANGALPDIVENGVTGFLVRTVEEMAAAIARAATLAPRVCQAQARARFSVERMVDQYIERYRWMVSQQSGCRADATTCRLSA